VTDLTGSSTPEILPASAEPLDVGVGRVGFVTRRRKPIGWAISDIANPAYEILAFATSGRATYSCRGATFDVTRGSMVYFPRGTPHSARSDPQQPWSFYSVGFEAIGGNADTRRRLGQLPTHVRLANTPQIARYFQQLQRAWARQADGFLLECRGLLLLLLQQFVSAAQQTERVAPQAAKIAAVVKFLHSNVGQTYSVGVLAGRAGLSESRFRVLFQRVTGLPVTRYQNHLRIAAAQNLLASGHWTVGAIADELGFQDVYYFSRLFKRMTGVSPTAWQNR
jgi:AraC-like DNA-binding protein